MLNRSVAGICRRSFHFTPGTKWVPPAEPVSQVLQKFSNSNSIEACKQIHAQLVISPTISKTHLTNTLLHFYSRCGVLGHARLLFDHMPHRNVVTWTSMISGYAHHRDYVTALQMFEEMLAADEKPNQYTLSVAVRACTNLSFPQLGLQIHGLVVRLGLESDEFAGSSLMDLYFKVVGSVEDAYCVFGRLSRRDSVTWNVMISRFSELGYVPEALRLLSEMQVVDGLKPNDFTVTSLLKCCSLPREVEQLHGLALKSGVEVDIVVGSALVDSYGKCESMGSGRKVFDSMAERDGFVWTSIISGCAKQGKGQESVILFRDMCRQGLRPDQHALSSTLKACCQTENMAFAIQAHTQMIKNGYQTDCVVASVLLTIYTVICDIIEAEKVFSRISHKDIVAWNSMILGYAQLEDASFNSITLFRELCRTRGLKPDGATFLAVLVSCHNISDLATGIQIHGMIIKSSRSCETQVANAIIHMYTRCGAVDDAYTAFRDIVCKDEISWSSAIGNYQQNGFELEALSFCKEMLANGMGLTNYSLPSCMAACSGLAAVDMGKQFHSLVVKLGLSRDVYVGSSVIDMYAKCGILEDSMKAFNEQEEPNEVTVNALITGYGQHGKASEAINIFKEMEGMGLKPNEITFLAIISACSHAGLVEESLFFFNMMQYKYNIMPKSEHYSCMVDVFGRAGRLEEAQQVIRNGSVSAWRTLLIACINYDCMKVAEKSAKQVIELDPSDHASYVLLSNIYSSEGKWEEALKLRQLMTATGAKKDPANSWLVLKDQVHKATVGDTSQHKIEPKYN